MSPGYNCHAPLNAYDFSRVLVNREHTVMTRRTIGFIVTLALGLLMAPLAADAQPSPKIPRIGVLGRTPGSAEGFRQALHDLGYREGQTIAIEYRWAEGQLDRLPNLAAELVRLQPDLLAEIHRRDQEIRAGAAVTKPADQALRETREHLRWMK